jgi:hypothetical protein
MPKRGLRRSWLPGFGVIALGCFFLIAGVAPWLRGGPQFRTELVDGIVIGVLCLAAGLVMVCRRSRDTRNTETQDGGLSS